MELKRYIADASMALKMAIRTGGAAVTNEPKLMGNPTPAAPWVEKKVSARVWMHVVTEKGARSERKIVVIPNIHADSTIIVSRS